MSDAPLATGFVAWHPHKGIADFSYAGMFIGKTFECALEEFVDDYDLVCAYRAYRETATEPILDFNPWLRKDGWQIIEVEIFRKAKEG